MDLKEESVTSTCSTPPSQVVEMHSSVDASFGEGEKLTTSSGSSSVSSTSTFVSLGNLNLSNGSSSF